jgi:hypothetical protein
MCVQQPRFLPSQFQLRAFTIIRKPCTYQSASLSDGDTQLSRFPVPAGKQMGEMKQDSEAADRGVKQLRAGLDMSLEETDGVSCTLLNTRTTQQQHNSNSNSNR